jgi:hypothetical protein
MNDDVTTKIFDGLIRFYYSYCIVSESLNGFFNSLVEVGAIPIGQSREFRVIDKADVRVNHDPTVPFSC